MCFSAQADFASSAVIGVVGLATLSKVERPRAAPLAALPLAFALHQVAEGFVWLDLEPGHAQASGVAVSLYLAFAWVALPILAPLSIMLVEPPGPVRRRMGIFVILGAIAGAYLSIGVPDSMPSWLRPIAEHNPFTIVTDASRALYNGKDPGNDPWIALAWAAGITLVFVTLSIRKFRTSTSR